MARQQWVPNEKKNKIKGVPANKPILMSFIIVLGVVVVLGIRENPTATLGILFLVVLPIYFVIRFGTYLIKGLHR